MRCQTCAVATLIVRLGDDAYVEWSNTTDAPVSHVMTRSEALEHLRDEDALDSDDALRLLDRADTIGTSDPAVDLDVLLATNRAGPGESRLSPSEILQHYKRS